MTEVFVEQPLASPRSAKGWEATFLIRDFGLSEEMSTKVGFAFSNNGFKAVVYIQIIRWSRSLCVIIEAHGVLRNFLIL